MNDDPYPPSHPDPGSESMSSGPAGWGPQPPPPDQPVTPSWENRASTGLIGAWFKTLSEVLLHSDYTFYYMKREGGLGSPLSFFALTFWTTQVIGFVFWIPSYYFMKSKMDRIIELVDRLGSPEITANLREALTNISISEHAFWALVATPLIWIVLLFVLSGLMHVMLLTLGGAKGPYETTFRTAAYAFGACSVLGLLPFCGCQSFLFAIALVVILSIGLTRSHETDTWRGVAAAIVPLALFLFCSCVGSFFFGAMRAATAGGV